MHTPRLCIDGRAAQDFAKGHVAQEVIDQLVSAQGEPDIGSPWVERHRAVLLSHPGQLFCGQLKRFDTPLRSRKSPVHFAWEKRFVAQAGINAFHRFRPINKIGPAHQCPTITTLLPSTGVFPYVVPGRQSQVYVVPSLGDAQLLQKTYQIPPTQVELVRACARRYVHFREAPKRAAANSVLFITNDGWEKRNQRRLISLLEKRFAPLPAQHIPVSRLSRLTPEQWVAQLETTRLCFYLVDKPFDWPALALEAFFWDIPVVFADRNASLAEYLPESFFKLSSFLTESLTLKNLALPLRRARIRLFEQGAFDPLGLAKQYRRVYSRLDQPMVENEGC